MPLRRTTHEVSVGLNAVAYTAKGSTRWSVDVSFVTDDGRPVRLQRRGFLTRGEALVWAEREIVLVKSGARQRDPKAAALAARNERITTAEALQVVFDWWRSSGRKKESTLSVDWCIIGKHLLPIIGSTTWVKLSQEQVDRVAHSVRPGASPRHLVVLKMAIQDARRAGLEPPAVEVYVPRYTANSRNDFISAAELDRLCAQAQPRMAAAFRFLFSTGIRIGEFLALEWSDLDLGEQRESMKIRRTVYPLTGGRFSVTSPKNSRHRTVPMNQSAVEALRELGGCGGGGGQADAPLGERLVFPSPAGGYLNKAVVNRAMISSCKKAGLRAISPHTLRHSFGSNLVQAGVDVYTVCTLMGHSSVAMTQRYAHLSEDGLRSSARKLDGLSRKAKKSKAHSD